MYGKKKHICIYMAMAFFLVLLLNAGLSHAAQSKPLVFGTSSVGSTFYIISVGMADIITKKTGINVSVEAVGGSDANVRALNQKKINLSALNLLSVASAYKGAEPFAKEGKIDLRVLLQGQESLQNIIVRAESGIKSPADLKGKKFIGIRPALANIGMVTDSLLKIYGIPKDSVKILTTTETKESLEALKLGSVDGAIIPAGIRASTLLELAQSVNVIFLPIPDDKMQAMLEDLGTAFHEVEIPKGTYKGQVDAVKMPAISTGIAVRSDFPEDMAYRVTMTLLESGKELAAVHSVGKEWTIANTLKPPPAPFHSGAIKYLKEKGLWTPALEKAQLKLLGSAKK